MSDHGAKAVRRTLVGAAAHLRGARPRRWWSIVALAVALGGWFVSGAPAAGPGGWDHLGDGGLPGSDSLDGAVYALDPAAPGALYVGGAFTSAGGYSGAAHIARWDGTGWSPVGSPALTGDVHAIAYDAGKVYVGGTFTNAGGNPNADFLAVWDGASWGQVCNGATAPITASVSALQIIGRKLYIGGAFADGAGLPSGDRLVACDLDTGAASSTVVDVAHEFSGSGIYALAADTNGVLYAGGGFSNLGGNPAADNVAYLDGSGWHAMGSGGGSCGCAVNDFVRSLTTVGTTVYAGTDAEDVAGIAQADNVVRWDGSAWSAVGSGAGGANGWFPPFTTIYGLTSDGSSVFATGSFQNADGDPAADGVAQFDGSAWHAMGSDGAGNGPWSGTGQALAFFAGQLVAGGNFASAGGDTQARDIARFTPLPAAVVTPTPTPVPAGPTAPAAPTVTISAPAANAFFAHPEQVRVSGKVVAPGGVAAFCVAANAAAIPPADACDSAAQIRPDGTFVDIAVPSGTQAGTNTITAYVLDTAGQEGEASVSIDLPNGLDLRTTSMEVTQAVQRLPLPINPGLPIPYSGVRLIQGATTVVRVYANAFATGRAPGRSIPAVPALLEGTRAGAPLPGSPLSPGSGPADLSAGPLSVPLSEVANPRSGYTYTLPESWTTGAPITLRSIVNPQGYASAVPEANLANNKFTLTNIGFEHRNPVLISPVRIRYVETDSQNVTRLQVPGDVETVFAGAHLVLPLGDRQLVVSPYQGEIDLTQLFQSTRTNPNRADIRFDAIFAQVSNWEGAHNAPGLTMGVITGNETLDARGREAPVLFSDGRLEPIAFANAARPLGSIVHEFLHTQNYFHAGQHCASGKSSDVSIRWDPDDQGFIQGIGLDRTPGSGGAPGTYRRLVPNARPLPLLSGQTAEYYDLMSYCNASGDESNLWIDPRTWDSFQSSPFPLGLPTLALTRVGRARAAAAGRTLRVSAAVNPDGSGEITSVGPGGSASPSDETSAYRLVVRDAAGAVVSSTGVTAHPTHVDANSGDVGAELAADVPAGDAPMTVELTQQGHVIAAKERSSHPPTVSLLSPKPGGRIGATGKVTVDWKAADADGDPLDVTIAYSADGGHSFRPLASGRFSGKTAVPAALFAKSGDGRIRITVGDGFDETSALVGKLRVAGAAPVVRILAPGKAQAVRPDATLDLSGEAFESSGAPIAASAQLTWFDGRRRVAVGHSSTLTGLSPGKHRLSLEARSANGKTGRASVTVKVLAIKPDLLVTAPPSIKRTARRVVLRIASTVPAIVSVGGRTFRVNRLARTVSTAIKPGAKPLVLRLGVRGGGGRASYEVRIRRVGGRR